MSFANKAALVKAGMRDLIFALKGNFHACKEIYHIA